MVEYKSAYLDDVFLALADGTRREIIALLCSGKARVTEIAQRFPVSLNAVSKHLKILERANLIERDVVGRDHWCALNTKALNDAKAWIAYHEAFWNKRLDRLERVLLARKSSSRHIIKGDKK
jgi:DNA-binding transcriptional ArsR family regulator